MPNPRTKISSKNNTITFWLDSNIYSLESVYSTAYIFLDRAYVFLDGDPKKEIEVHLKGKDKLNEKNLEALQGEFLNELLNFLLRVEVSRSNQKTREYIVASALVSSLPGEILNQSSIPEEESTNWEDDPLGIAVPWEEKSGKKTGEKKRKKRPGCC